MGNYVADYSQRVYLPGQQEAFERQNVLMRAFEEVSSWGDDVDWEWEAWMDWQQEREEMR